MVSESGPNWADAALESQADGVLIVDADNKVISVNSEMRRMWGFPEDVLKFGCSVSLAESVKDKLVDPSAFMAQVGQTGSFSDPDLTDLYFRDGRIIERSARLVKGPQDSPGRVLVFRDVTQRRRTEETRQLMANRLQAAQKLESLGVLAGGIAHEFNNMLMVILGNADLLQDKDPVKSENEESLKEIQFASRRAADLCNQMLAFAGKGRFVVEPVSLQSIVDEMQGILNISIGKRVSLHCNYEDNLPLIEADLTQVRQVIMNLVTNASEACSSVGGNILLEVKVSNLAQEFLASSVSGKDLKPGPYLMLKVADSGKGMEPELMNRIFEPFFSTNFAGRGLGLPAVLGILRGHKGGVHVESLSGRGSVVSVFFPVSQVEHAKCLDRVVDSEQLHKSTGKVLLVDDEKTVLRVGRLLLERAGFKVDIAANGLEAIEILEKRRSEFSCVILDLTMPVMDGLECSRIIKKHWLDLPVILSSGYTKTEATNSFDGELAGFLHKPYVGQNLIEMVGKWADRST